jgi:hypothetical protein
MATSGTYGFSTNRDFIITEAFRKIGALGDGETIDATRLTIGSNVLNPMVKAFSSYGMSVWTLDKISIPLSEWANAPELIVGPTGTYVIDYKPLAITDALRSDGSIETPLIQISNSEYENQPTKTQTGTPTMFYYKPEAYVGKIYLWQPPDTYWDANGTLETTFRRQIQDLDTSTDEPDFPIEWHEALIYQLAVRLAPNYGLAPNDRMILKKEACTFL